MAPLQEQGEYHHEEFHHPCRRRPSHRQRRCGDAGDISEGPDKSAQPVIMMAEQELPFDRYWSKN